jgi:methionine synthase I (cobalamin-dependent)
LSSALAAAKSENSTLKSELEKFSSSDPAVIDAMRDGAKIAKQAANVWTDNIFMMKSWVDSKMGDKDSVKQFFKSEGDINLDTFDYVE